MKVYQILNTFLSDIYTYQQSFQLLCYHQEWYPRNNNRLKEPQIYSVVFLYLKIKCFFETGISKIEDTLNKT
jgi:hypothetical protein